MPKLNNAKQTWVLSAKASSKDSDSPHCSQTQSIEDDGPTKKLCMQI